MSKIPVAIWDLCQTLADTRHRLPLILERKPAQWDEFHRRAIDDTLFKPAAQVFNALRFAGLKNVICTGRGEAGRATTEAWLEKHHLHPHIMFMRRDGDGRGSPAVKLDMLLSMQVIGYHPIMAFEDHPETMQMYRSNGVWCWGADDSEWRERVFREIPHEPPGVMV